MTATADIKFVLTPYSENNSSSTRTTEQRQDTGGCTLNELSVLSKVTGDVCVAKRAVRDPNKLIQEEEVEVIDLKLLLHEFVVLYSSCQQ